MTENVKTVFQNLNFKLMLHYRWVFVEEIEGLHSLDCNKDK